MAAYIWKENILHRKRETFWFSERKGNKRKESRFKKEEKKIKERGDFHFWNRFRGFGGWYIRKKGCWEKRGIFIFWGDHLEEKHKGAGKERLQLRLSRSEELTVDFWGFRRRIIAREPSNRVETTPVRFQLFPMPSFVFDSGWFSDGSKHLFH